MSMPMMMDEARCIFLSFALRLQSNCHIVDDDDDNDGNSNEDGNDDDGKGNSSDDDGNGVI